MDTCSQRTTREGGRVPRVEGNASALKISHNNHIYLAWDPQVLHWTEVCHALLGTFQTLSKHKSLLKPKHSHTIVFLATVTSLSHLFLTVKKVEARQISDSDVLCCAA